MSGGHLTDDLRARLANDELEGRELREVLQHVSTCALCTPHTATAEAEALGMLDVCEPIEHLEFDTQLLPYVEHRLDAADLEIVESHLDDCALCRAEADDLRREIEPEDHSGWRVPLAAAAALGALALLGTFLLRDQRGPVSPTPPVVTTQNTIPTHTPPVPPIRRLPADWQKLVDAALSSRTLTYPRDLESLSPRSDELRGSPTPPASKVWPAGIVIREQQPRFTWPARTGATYVVHIYANEEEVQHSDVLSSPHWTPTRPLPRGRTYVWEVEITEDETTVRIPTPPAPPAMFRITTAEDERALTRALTEWPEDPVLHAVLYARAGLRREAEQAWGKRK